MKKPELLAPAGNMESLKAAVLAGCDAVYLGGHTFGARSYAGNFSNEEILEAVLYCHLRGVRVYVTVNTLIHESRFDMCINYIDFLHQNNIDAVIIQDLGLMDYVRRVYPNLEVHASTQMHIHNLEGVLFAQSLGLKRAVVARETSIECIREMKEKSSIEIEVFVHGALCVSYSGQCLMSSMLGGRSGNLGNCSQCCRMKYDFINDGKKINKDSYLLSTKDLNTIEHIGRLIDIGVDSLKIEGRMKRPEYVYMVVSLYRKAIDNYMKYHTPKMTTQDIEELSLLFNRQFTKGFLFNEVNENFIHSFRPNHMGLPIGKVVGKIKNKVSILLSRNLSLQDGIRILCKAEDVGLTVTKMFYQNRVVQKGYKSQIITILVDGNVKVGDIVVKTTDIEQLHRIQNSMKMKKTFSVSGHVSIRIGEPIVFTVSDGIHKVEAISHEPVSQSKTSPTTKDRIVSQLRKFGGTIYHMDKLSIDFPNENVFIPISTLNELRRDVVRKLNEKRLEQIPYEKKDYTILVPDFEKKKNEAILIQTIEEYRKIKNSNFDIIYVEDISLYSSIEDYRLVLRLPRVMNQFKPYKVPLLIGEVGSLYKYKNLDIFTDFSFNVVNSYTVAFLHSIGVKRITLSYELTMVEIESIIYNYEKRYGKHPNIEVIVSSTPEVMISKFNLLQYFGVSGDNNYLRDSFGNLFKVTSSDDFMRVYHYKKVELNPKQCFKVGVNTTRIHY